MNKEEIKEKLFKQFIYELEESKQNIDYCGNCDKFVMQKDYNGSFACEHCGSENIEIIEVEE